MKSNPKPRGELEILLIVLGVLCLGLGAALAVQRPVLLLGVLLLAAAAGVLLALWGGGLRSAIARYLSGDVFEGSSVQFSLAGLPNPTMLLGGKTVLWYNDAFRQALLNDEDYVLQPVSRVLPGLELHSACQPGGQSLECKGRRWWVFSSPSDKDRSLAVVHLVDVTDVSAQAAEYRASRPVYMLFQVDGSDVLLENLRESERARLLEGVNLLLEHYIGRTTGFLRRVASTRYVAVVEERHLTEMIAGKFDILDKMRALDENVGLTLSIGVGHGGTLAECQQMARQSLDMALGRGGDQAAVKTENGFEFYGGVSRSIEKHSKVRSRMVAAALVDAIRRSDSVLIMGHRMSDLDSVGAALGVLRVCHICDVPAAIAIRKNATLAASLIHRFEEAGLEESFIDPDRAREAVTPDTLLVVVDTCLVHMVESRELYEQCARVAVIDHHRRAMGAIPNAAVWYQEPYASSACELVSELLQYAGEKGDKPTQLEAEALLAGIMLDTRNFALHTGVRTFEAAAWLRRMGARTEEVKQLFSTSLEEYAAKASLVENAEVYLGCAISVAGELPPQAQVAVPQAANDLLTIDGVEASFVAVEKNGGVNISARSMGAVNVQVILETLGGGGHLTMAGAQLKGVNQDEARRRIRDAVRAFRQEQAEKMRSSAAQTE